MKQLFYTIVILLVLTASACIIQSCAKPDDDPHCGEIRTSIYKIFDSDRAKIPYKGDEAIIMISNQGDTITCYGEGKEDFDTREYVLNPNPACGNKGGTLNVYEAYSMKFIPQNDNYIITFQQYTKILAPKFEYFDVKISFSSYDYYIWANHISKSSIQNYVGSTKIGNVTYADVTKIYKNGDDTSSYILFNRNNGILMIYVSQNEIWKILN